MRVPLQNRRPEFVPDQAKWRIASAVAAVAGLFTLVLASLLIINYLQIRATDPLDHPELLKLREQLAAASEPDEALVEQIRTLDLLVRKAFFTSQAQLRLGGRLLLAGAIVFVVAIRLAARWNPKTPAPEGAPDRMGYWRTLAQSRELLTGVAIVLVLATLAAAYMTPLGIPAPVVQDEAGEGATETDTVPGAPASAVPSWEDMLIQWPSFRGPGGYGVAHFTTAPVNWDLQAGEGIRWNVEAPQGSFNSPVVWGARLFLSGISAA